MTVKEIAIQVAKLLNVVSAEMDERFYIILSRPEVVVEIKTPNPDDPSIWVHQQWNDQKRITFSGSFDGGLSQFLPYGDQREKTDITVSVEKSPEKMARDIQSRLLPPYLRMHELCSRRKAEYDKQETEKQAILKNLSEYFPDPLIRNNELFWHGGGPGGSIQITYHSPDDMTVKLSCDFRMVKKILEILK